jgi:hypothetical protein
LLSSFRPSTSIIVRHIFLMLCVFLTATVHAGTSDTLFLSRLLNIPEGQTVLVVMGDKASVAIVGQLNQEVLARYREENARHGITTLYIDSVGGDVTVAIALANELRRQGTRVIVAGRCFSACANYIFTAAVRKTVLPGSLIAIHGKRVGYGMENDRVYSVSSRDQYQLLKLGNETKIRGQLAALSKIESAFYSRVDVKMDYYDAFEKYAVFSEKELKANKPMKSCRKIDAWILSRDDLAHMGVTGMDAVWAPTSQNEAEAAASALGLAPSQIYFGSAQKLVAMCDRTAAPQ